MNDRARNCWVIHDGAAGNRRQAVALAEALGWAFEEKAVESGVPDKWFAPRILPWSATPFGTTFANAARNPPTHVIGCGRQTALATRLLKQAGSFAIQILNPRLHSRYWDVVIAPKHDYVRGDNVIQCTGSLHDVNSTSLHRWRAENTVIAKLKAPRTVVLIGGPGRMASFNEGLLEVMFSHLEYDLAKHQGSLIVCGSRRTPKSFAHSIRQRFADTDTPIWFDQSDGENIYHAASANADRIVVTPDSVNMISEACATSAMVYVAQPERASRRMKVFLDELKKSGRVQSLSRQLETRPVTALKTMSDVITKLRQFLPGEASSAPTI